MYHGQTVLVACALSEGAFSAERVFRLTLADGKTTYSGVAPLHYCLTSGKKPLKQDQPAPGQSIEGYVEAFLVANGGEQAMVELPDGEAVRVNVSQVPFRQDQNR